MRAILLFVLGLLAATAAGLGWALARSTACELGPFRFDGPPGLELREDGRALLRDAPLFAVWLHGEEDARVDPRAAPGFEPRELAGEPAFVRRYQGEAPGGVDHGLYVRFPQHGDGLSIAYRAREGGLVARADAWVCERWAERALTTLRRAPAE